MSDMMFFPASWEDFLREYSFKDKEEIYTNGADLISVFRVRQMMGHYHHDWISVKDRLPEKSGIYLVYGNRGNGKTAIDTADFAVHQGYFSLWDFTVTHWMSLPTPPQG